MTLCNIKVRFFFNGTEREEQFSTLTAAREYKTWILTHLAGVGSVSIHYEERN